MLPRRINTEFRLFAEFVRRDLIATNGGVQNLQPQQQQTLLTYLASRYRRAVLPTFRPNAVIVINLIQQLIDTIATFPDDFRKEHVLFILNNIIA